MSKKTQGALPRRLGRSVTTESVQDRRPESRDQGSALGDRMKRERRVKVDRAESNREVQELVWTLLSRPAIPSIAKGTTALLCIDMQYRVGHQDFGHGRTALSAGLDRMMAPFYSRVRNIVLPNVRLLQDAAREQGIEIIHLRVASQTEDGRDSTRRYKALGLQSPRHTKEAEILPEVAPKGDEIVIDKITSSPFHSTGIDRVLRSLNIQTLIVTGLVTEACVESTVRSAAEHDYDVIVVEDGAAAWAPQLHENAILSMGGSYAAIMTTEEVVRAISEL